MTSKLTFPSSSITVAQDPQLLRLQSAKNAPQQQLAKTGLNEDAKAKDAATQFEALLLQQMFGRKQNLHLAPTGSDSGIEPHVAASGNNGIG